MFCVIRLVDSGTKEVKLGRTRFGMLVVVPVITILTGEYCFNSLLFNSVEFSFLPAKLTIYHI